MKTCLKCTNSLETKEAIYGLHRQCFAEWFEQTESKEFRDLDPKKSAATSHKHSSEMKKQENTFFHGNYLKYSARLDQTEYILKVKEPRYPELPLVEYLCNQIADMLKIEIPSYYLINFNGQITFVTRNFMQDYTGTLHHIYKFLPKGDESYNCEQIIKVVSEQTGRLVDVAKFIEICLFDTLIGNNDRHGRNIGIIETASIKKLAPMYDNPSCLGIEDDFFLVSDINPSGSIWTKESKHPKPLDYFREFQSMGYEDIIISFIIKVSEQLHNIINTIQNSLLTHNRKTALIKLIQKRAVEFNNAR